MVDVDGTLLGKKGVLSLEDKKALTQVRDSGIQVSLSTGRATIACLAIVQQLSLDGYQIFFDGALISDPTGHQEVYIRLIDPDLVKQVVEFVHANEINLELYSATGYFVERETWSTEIRRRFFGIEPAIVDFAGIWQRERIIKGTTIVQSPEEKAKAKKFHRHFGRCLAFSWTNTPAYPDVDFINVLNPRVSKGDAMEVLTSFLGIDLARVVAIGDGANDIPLFTRVGLSIAMGNAPDEVKAAADYITLDIEHSGVAAAIEEFVL